MLITLAVCSITASAAEPTHPKLQKELLAAEKEDQAIRKRLFAKGAQNLDQDVAMKDEVARHKESNPSQGHHCRIWLADL